MILELPVGYLRPAHGSSLRIFADEGEVARVQALDEPFETDGHFHESAPAGGHHAIDQARAATVLPIAVTAGQPGRWMHK